MKITISEITIRPQLQTASVYMKGIPVKLGDKDLDARYVGEISLNTAPPSQGAEILQEALRLGKGDVDVDTCPRLYNAIASAYPELERMKLAQAKQDVVDDLKKLWESAKQLADAFGIELPR